MARITVDDCLEKIPNRFQMTLVAAYRARQIYSGAESLIDSVKKDKPTVQALREVGQGKVGLELLDRRTP